jgi:integrase
MPAHIVVRTTAKGERRYLVRVQVGGRGGALLHLGSFKRRVEAEECKAWASLELARGVVPDRRKLLGEQVKGLQTLRAEAQQWLKSRVDLAELSHEGYHRAIEKAPGVLWTLTTRQIQTQDVQDFVGDAVNLGYGHSSISRWVSIIQQTLDYAGVEPNPARRKLRMPPKPRSVPDPPSSVQVAAILNALSRRYRLPVALLEATGMRVGELVALEWGDVDVAGCRVRIPQGKTRSARRYVPVPPELMVLVDETLPAEDRYPERRVFPDLTRGTVGEAMARACRTAGLPRFSPHDLRHRYLSRLVQLGYPITEVQQLAGHARASLTVDRYGHVLTDVDEGWRHVVSTLAS